MLSTSQPAQDSLRILIEPSWQFSLNQRLTLLKDLLLCCVLAFVLPNLITWTVFGNSPELFRGWLNVEVALMIAAYWQTRFWPWLILLGVGVIADLLEPLAHTFYFDVEDAVEALRFLNVLPTSRILLGAFALLGYLGVILFLVSAGGKKIARRRLTSIGTVVVCLLSLGYEALSGRYVYFTHADSRLPVAMLIRTPVASIGTKLWKLSQRQRKPSQPIDSPVTHFLASEGPSVTGAKPNIVFVMVESWGFLRNNAALRNGLTAPLRTPDLETRYDIESGLVPFVGSTIFGESRDLCATIFGNGIENATPEQLHHCYPAQFSNRGYQTVGIHGFYSRMYGRERWFPKAGFQESLFEGQLANMGMNTCPGGLVGTCDEDIAEYIHQRLRKAKTDRPQFIRWTTLNSHLPVEVSTDSVAAAGCKTTPGLQNDDTLCVWYSLVKKVNEAVARTASDRTIPPTAFIVVGDHAPPFYSSERRAQFSQTQVPYIILTPRSILGTGASEQAGF